MSGTTGRKFLGLHPFFAPKNGWNKKYKSYFLTTSFFYIINIIITCHITCLYRLPRSLRSLAMTYNSSHSLTGLAPFSRVVRPKIRYRPRLMFFITRPIIFISTFESGVSTSFLYFLLSDIISSVPSSFRLNLFARHSLFEQNT